MQHLIEMDLHKRPDRISKKGKEPLSIAERLARSTTPEPNTGCHIWTGILMPKGYGKIGTVNGSTMTAHRAAWIVHNGPITDGLHVLHRCDSPWCVNPDHLFLGTNKQNIEDKVAKGRSPKGEKNAQAKLTTVQVAEIKFSGAPPIEMCRKFGIRRQVVSYIRCGHAWQHVTEDMYAPHRHDV